MDSMYVIAKSKSYLISNIAIGIKNILARAHTGMGDWLEIEIREKYKQIELKL